MKRFLAVLLVCFFCADAHAQLLPRIFRPRDRVYPVCPGPDRPDNVAPNSPHPGLNPEVRPEVDLEVSGIIAELDKVIPPEVRVQNKGPNCGWCALEDVMVAAGYEQFRGMRDRAYKKGWNGNTISNIESALRDSGTEYKIVKNRDYSIFDHARTEGVGVYVEIPGHALVCLAVDDKHAYMLDNNGSLKIQAWTRSKFNRLWNGVACCPKFKLPRIFPPKKPKDDPKPEVKPLVGPVKPCDCPKDQGCKCDAKGLTDALGKLTEVATLTNKSVGELSTKVGEVDRKVSTIDQRLTVVEGRQAEIGKTPPPSTTVSDTQLTKIQTDLDALRKSLNGSATLRVTVTPR